jgi:hypothetical protein
LCHDFGQARLYQPTEISHVDVIWFARKQQTAELVLHFLDTARQGRLTNLA